MIEFELFEDCSEIICVIAEILKTETVLLIISLKILVLEDRSLQHSKFFVLNKCFKFLFCMIQMVFYAYVKIMCFVIKFINCFQLIIEMNIKALKIFPELF